MSRATSGSIKNSLISRSAVVSSNPMKDEFFESRGVSLASFDFRLISLLEEKSDFKALASDAGLPREAPRELRILVSDNAYTSLPDLAVDHPLLCAMQIGDQRKVYPSELNPDVLGFSTEEKNITSDILLIGLDIAFANSSFPTFVRKSTGASIKHFLKEKASFAASSVPRSKSKLDIASGSPYVPFSAIFFSGSLDFSNHAALDEFVDLWDKFLASKLSGHDTKRLVADYLCNLPKFGRQLPRLKLERLLSGMSGGTYLFALRTRSKKIASQSTKNALYSAFTSLPHFHTGPVDFGFIRADGRGDTNKTLPNLRRLEQEGAVSLIRVTI